MLLDRFQFPCVLIFRFATQVLCGVLLVPLLPPAIASGQAEDDELQSGLVATYRQKGREAVRRVDRRLAFDWQEGPPDARLADGLFAVAWRGLLMSQGNGAYRFHAYFRGKLTVQLAGETVLRATSEQAGWRASDPIELPFDWHPLDIDYQSDGREARLALFWSGPGFGLEPVPPSRLFHEPPESPPRDFERGAKLVRAFRCAACHQLPGEKPGDAKSLTDGSSQRAAVAAPALDRLPGNLNREWLRDWLRHSHSDAAQPLDVETRRMPYFDLADQDVEALAAYLLSGNVKKDASAAAGSSGEKPAPGEKPNIGEKPNTGEKPSGKPGDAKSKPDAGRGERLFLTTGCLACHQADSLGTGGAWSGGDLSAVGRKRPQSFFAGWLAEPSRYNRDHRMPRVELTAAERADLAEYLAGRTGTAETAAGAVAEAAAEEESDPRPATLIERGKVLFREYRCHACHAGPSDEARDPVRRVALSNARRQPSGSDDPAGRSCLAAPGERFETGPETQPHYPLDEGDRQAVRRFLADTRGVASRPELATALLNEKNCFACHERADAEGLAPRLTAVAERHGELAALLPAMTPPSLESVGDKLQDKALRDAILRRGPVHRPWLRVRMPHYDLAPEQVELLADYFVATDRIAERPEQAIPEVSEAVRLALGGRLVSTAGFGCTSCHQVGRVEPPQAPLNAKGPDLSQLGQRIRYAWFDRWVRNPARIVPRMEMPSVKLAVRGLLDEDLDRQLATVWHVLNQPGFEPPEANPVRVARQSGTDPRGRAEVLTDVVHSRGGPVFIKPLLIGLPNRHNILYDLEHARPARWTVGDTALQRTKGKTWFWELAGAPAADWSWEQSEWRLVDDGNELAPLRQGQFLTEFDSYAHRPGGIVFRHRLHFAVPETPSSTPKKDAEQESSRAVVVEQEWTVPSAVGAEPTSSTSAGFDRRVTIVAPEAGDARLRLRLVPDSVWSSAELSEDGRTVSLPGVAGVRISIVDPPTATIDKAGFVELPPDSADRSTLRLRYRTALPVDRFPHPSTEPTPLVAQPLKVVPGWDAQRLPLPEEIMPTGLAWRPDGSLVFTSLKGRVWLARDTDGDGLEDRLNGFGDELAAPFGVAAGEGYVDVINKYALLRLHDDDGDDRVDRVRTLASGWGHTTDYHDWAVGLPSDSAGGYFLATACQQDQRSPAAARWRGRVLRLVPRRATPDDPRAFEVQVVSEGHRFPIGIARNGQGELFVTDNQGNYNPFNELNHVLPGKHYGFLNALERGTGERPPLTPPAINIPHPWTRSVNGICFLETPRELRERGTERIFGPWEGHLVGCEYDTRRLIRMSLERVGDTWQGAAYPLTYDQPPEGEPLRGPLSCAVSPDGDLYVGCIRDSGWGGANNVGSIVRLRPPASEMPAGLAEVQATSTGFRLLLTRPVDRNLASDRDNYAITSYTRTATPAYGGPDQNRRKESLQGIEVSEDGRAVRLELAEMREGYVYEIRLKPLVSAGQPFFPAEAYYTLNRVP